MAGQIAHATPASCQQNWTIQTQSDLPVACRCTCTPAVFHMGDRQSISRLTASNLRRHGAAGMTSMTVASQVLCDMCSAVQCFFRISHDGCCHDGKAAMQSISCCTSLCVIACNSLYFYTTACPLPASYKRGEPSLQSPKQGCNALFSNPTFGLVAISSISSLSK